MFAVSSQVEGRTEAHLLYSDGFILTTEKGKGKGKILVFS
jgi:hypothetical protein